MEKHNEKMGNGMMWMMVICCSLPLAIVLLGGTTLFSGVYVGPIIIGILALAWIGAMVRGHRRDKAGSSEQMGETSQVAPGDAKKDDHSCCH